jgi:hypothetical protein
MPRVTTDAVAVLKKGIGMNASVKMSTTIDPLLHPRDAAKILKVSTSWAKAAIGGPVLGT